MSELGLNGGATSRWFGTVPVGVWVFLFAQLITAIVWGIRLESRVAANEFALQDLNKRMEFYRAEEIVSITTQAKELRTLIERIDRLDTPLSHKVEGLVKAIESLGTTSVTQ